MRARPGRPAETGGKTAAWQAGLAGIALLAGMLGSLWGAWGQARQEQAKTAREFQQAADKAFARTLREIQLFMEVLDSIRQLHSLSDRVTAEAFDEIARKGMAYQRRILGAYGFVQRIPDEMREEFERQGGGRAVVRGRAGGGYEPAERAGAYYPLTYQMPPNGLGVPVGYDFSTRDEDREAIASMLRWGVFALGGGRPGDGGKQEIYMFAPILYGMESGGSELVGFAVGLFDVGRVMAAAKGAAPETMEIRLEAAAGEREEVSEERGEYAKVFSLANQEWRFVAKAGLAGAGAARSWLPELIAVAGTGASAALAGALLLMAGRSRRVEALVRVRTAELAEANRRLEAAMEERRELEDEVLRIGGREKARIGRDLHDSLGQKLTGAMYLFGSYRQRARGASPETEADAAQIAATLKDAVSQVRRIARGLAPVALTEDGLPDALRRLAEEATVLYGKRVEFYAEREGRPKDPGTAEHLYLIAQEAVNNAAKHGKATHVAITLDYEQEGGVLTVEDDGGGFAASAKPDREGGNGLRIMRHRAEVLGGRLAVESEPGKGVRVECHFPGGEHRGGAG